MSASGAVPAIVIVSPVLSISRARALDPAGTLAGLPTAIVTSSVLEPLSVRRIISDDMLRPSTQEIP